MIPPESKKLRSERDTEDRRRKLPQQTFMIVLVFPFILTERKYRESMEKVGKVSEVKTKTVGLLIGNESFFSS